MFSAQFSAGQTKYYLQLVDFVRSVLQYANPNILL